MELNKRQLKQLKALGHQLKPVVRIGQNGLTDAVLAELEIALDHHELVKIKIAGEDRAERSEITDKICSESKALCVSMTGGIALLFRQNTSKPGIQLIS